MSKQKKKSNDLTESEWIIMKIVWEHEPCAAGTVQEALKKEKGWAYSTVKTTMDRMVKKGILSIENVRNLQLFSSELSQKDARQGAALRTLKRAFDGALTPMVKLLMESEELPAEEIQKLRKLIDETSEEKK